MNLHDDIKAEAHNLYEKSGRIEGRDLENWLEAEKIVMERHAGEQEAAIQEPESEKTVQEPQPEVEKSGKKKR